MNDASLKQVSLRQLRYFEALAQTRHFGQAAEICQISQPALSMQIKELESAVGAALVERGPRRVRLTRLGEQFALHVRDIMARVSALEDVVRAAQAPFTGRLGIGAIPTVAPYLLPAIVQEIGTRYPGLDVRPREAVTARLIEELLSGQIDVAVVALPISQPGLEEVALFDEEFVLVRSLADADKPVPSAETLREMRLLLLEEGHCFREQALAFCALPSAPADLMEGSSLTTLVQMVGAGIGVTLLPQMAMAMESASAQVSFARLAAPRPSRTIGLVWRTSNPLVEELQTFAEVVREVGLRERREGPGWSRVGFAEAS